VAIGSGGNGDLFKIVTAFKMTKKELIAAVNNTNFCTCENRGYVLRVRFSFDDFCTAALIVPEGYCRQPDDPPVFSYKEFLGLSKHGNKEMFRQMCMFKDVWHESEATGINYKTAGGFRLAGE